MRKKRALPISRSKLSAESSVPTVICLSVIKGCRNGKSDKELDNFLYSTSHDLRSPIASILGITFLGKMELQEQRARDFMGMIEERIKKLDIGIASILSLTRSKKFDLNEKKQINMVKSMLI